MDKGALILINAANDGEKGFYNFPVAIQYRLAEGVIETLTKETDDGVREREKSAIEAIRDVYIPATNLTSKYFRRSLWFGSCAIVFLASCGSSVSLKDLLAIQSKCSDGLDAIQIDITGDLLRGNVWSLDNLSPDNCNQIGLFEKPNEQGVDGFVCLKTCDGRPLLLLLQMKSSSNSTTYATLYKTITVCKKPPRNIADTQLVLVILSQQKISESTRREISEFGCEWAIFDDWGKFATKTLRNRFDLASDVEIQATSSSSSSSSASSSRD